MSARKKNRSGRYWKLCPDNLLNDKSVMKFTRLGLDGVWIVGNHKKEKRNG